MTIYIVALIYTIQLLLIEIEWKCAAYSSMTKQHNEHNSYSRVHLVSRQTQSTHTLVGWHCSLDSTPHTVGRPLRDKIMDVFFTFQS